MHQENTSFDPKFKCNLFENILEIKILTFHPLIHLILKKNVTYILYVLSIHCQKDKILHIHIHDSERTSGIRLKNKTKQSARRVLQ